MVPGWRRQVEALLVPALEARGLSSPLTGRGLPWAPFGVFVFALNLCKHTVSGERISCSHQRAAPGALRVGLARGLWTCDRKWFRPLWSGRSTMSDAEAQSLSLFPIRFRGVCVPLMGTPVPVMGEGSVCSALHIAPGIGNNSGQRNERVLLGVCV